MTTNPGRLDPDRIDAAIHEGEEIAEPDGYIWRGPKGKGKRQYRPPNPGSTAAREVGCTCKGGVYPQFITSSGCELHPFAASKLSEGFGWTVSNAWEPGEIHVIVEEPATVQQRGAYKQTTRTSREYPVPDDWVDLVPLP